MEINNFHISNLHFLLSIAVGEYALNIVERLIFHVHTRCSI